MSLEDLVDHVVSKGKISPITTCVLERLVKKSKWSRSRQQTQNSDKRGNPLTLNQTVVHGVHASLHETLKLQKAMSSRTQTQHHLAGNAKEQGLVRVCCDDALLRPTVEARGQAVIVVR